MHSSTDSSGSAAHTEQPDDGDLDHAERDEARQGSLPPGSGRRGEPDDIPGDVREAAPYEDAPAEGRLAPDADNPPPS